MPRGLDTSLDFKDLQLVTLAPAGAEFKHLGFARKAHASERCFGHMGKSSSDLETPGIRYWRGLLIIHQNVENCS